MSERYYRKRIGMKQEHMRTGTNEIRKDGTIIIGEATKMKKIMYLLFVLVMSISLSGCQKPDFYTEDFTAMSGNTSDNIWQGGLLASTDKYLYGNTQGNRKACGVGEYRSRVWIHQRNQWIFVL